MKHISNNLKETSSLSEEEAALKFKEQEKEKLLSIGDEVSFKARNFTRLSLIGTIIQEVIEEGTLHYKIQTLLSFEDVNVFLVPYKQVKKNEHKYQNSKSN